MASVTPIDGYVFRRAPGVLIFIGRSFLVLTFFFGLLVYFAGGHWSEAMMTANLAVTGALHYALGVALRNRHPATLPIGLTMGFTSILLSLQSSNKLAALGMDIAVVDAAFFIGMLDMAISVVLIAWLMAHRRAGTFAGSPGNL